MDEINKTTENEIKKKHPLERANVFSLIFFCWLLPYFKKGLKRELNEDDMYGALKTHKSERLGDKLETEWNKQLAKSKDPSLWKAVLNVFGKELMLFGIVNIFTEFVLRILYPIVLARFLAFYEPNQTEVTKNDAYLYSALLVFITFCNVLCGHSYQLHIMHLGMKLRVAACSLIYRKAVRLSKTSLVDTTIGQMVNLLSNDVSRFDSAMQFVHYLWIAPIQTVLVMTLLYQYVGPTGMIGAVFLLLFIPIQMYMGKKTSQFRLKTAMRTDERVRLMNEIVSGIQVIKMYTWEKPFAKLVQLSRMKELKQIRFTTTIRALMLSCSIVMNSSAIYWCILVYVLTGNVINASYIYTLTSFYGILRNNVTTFLPHAITQVAEANVSVKRIKQFLLYDEIKKTTSRNKQNGVSLLKKENEDVGIRLNNVSVKWLRSATENNLENINFKVSSKELVAVIGPVGGGKTTLLHAILNELSPQEGVVDVHGDISYASQEPWLFGGSVRQNIIFGQEFNQNKYDEVITVCALERDFTLFPHGDRTLVGDRGVTLSGGQRARINLARAIYKDADIYLLDDPLSAVDTHVGKQLFDECITSYLKDKCVVLVTHQIQYLRNVNKIYLLEGGRVTASGSYADIKASETVFTKLMANEKEEEEEQRRKSRIKDKIEEDEPQRQEKEERGSGKISWAIYKGYLKAGGNWLTTISLLFIFVVCQITASSTDYFISIWANTEQLRASHNLTYEAVNITDVNVTTSGLSEVYSPTFLETILTKRNALIIYTCLVITTVILTVTRSISFFRYCINASKRLHNLMFDKIVFATMRFFNINPTGRILNRFSMDIGAVDESLPATIIDTLQIGLSVLAITMVIGSLNPWIFLPTLAILVIFYCMRMVFLATSRDVKRIEAITRSPIFTHLSASLQGLTTIRAFGAETLLKEEFDNYQDQYSAAYFMFLAANRTFGFWLDFHCIIYISLVIVSILFIEGETFAGNVGLALTQSTALTGVFQWGMRQWSELENKMTAVERIQQYIDVTPESDEFTKEPPKFWPEKGAVKFIKLCLRYAPEEPYVLRDLTFEIKPKEKVGVVGRTGAGKSSLISALFRLTDIDGKILIDDVDTKEIALQVLRTNISIIPQEPVLFSGTLRKNLDPFDEYNDETLWSALEEVELKHAVSDLPSGLDSKMSEGGSNFSVGQRQLLCLARAIIRNNKILVLDEATANVDPHTDNLIQTTIRRKFEDCTVLTIAHRLHTIMDSDKVLVMDAGKVAEFDHPYTLLQNPFGIFTGLVNQTGKAMTESLTLIAQENFTQNNQ